MVSFEYLRGYLGKRTEMEISDQELDTIIGLVISHLRFNSDVWYSEGDARKERFDNAMRELFDVWNDA